MIDTLQTDCADRPRAVLPDSRLRGVAAWGLARAAVALHGALGDRNDDGSFGILMYHRVAERTPGVAAPTINVTPQGLRRQLEGLLAAGFEAWPLSRLLECHAYSRSVGSKAFAITFDDGFENNYLDALPILQDLNLPATVFVATAFLDSDAPFPNDNWAAAGAAEVPDRSWRPLSTEQCHALLDSGLVELGAHTHTHAFFLDRVDDFREDMARCVDVLHTRFGISRPTFSFPFGLSSPEMIEVARQTGVTCGLTTRPDRVTPGCDPFRWGRFGATEDDTAATLAAKLSGWYSPLARTLRGLQHPFAKFGTQRMRANLRLRNPSFVFLDEKLKTSG